MVIVVEKIIGFSGETVDKGTECIAEEFHKENAPARKSLVQIHFPQRGMELAYYNDMFDLVCGDLVYVDGKLEGMLGRVTNVSYNFKIKLSAYKRVIAKVDTDIKGKLTKVGGFFAAFDRETLPSEKISLWFKPPENDGEEYAEGSDETGFYMDELERNFEFDTVNRGMEYRAEKRVLYIKLDGTKGYALVKGREIYEVEFNYSCGRIHGLACSCYCSFNCKHEYAVLAQLRELLQAIEEFHGDEYKSTGFFAAISSEVFFEYVINGKERLNVIL